MNRLLNSPPWCDIWDSLPLLNDLPRGAQDEFMNVLRHYYLGASDSNESDPDREQLQTLATDLAHLVTLPLDPRVWGFEFEPSKERVHEGCLAMLRALSLFIPEPGTGQPLAHYPGSLIPHLRDPDDPVFGRSVVVLDEDAES